ncbi:hypothetical protein CVT91_14775 [Candidatus Atribacteria bacterium HGW-Atribacteria-1]|nr:MAG: hypothetical protein CVT91_14775 [Candidatus Atribacteria bacterium HGW-Atribacteria-1]
MSIIHISKGSFKSISKQSYRNKEIGDFGEKSLQDLLIDFPELIPSDYINPEEPPIFIVVRNEAGVTAGSMDILLLDQYAVPTVVETKLIDNREIRRSVLAQGIEYLSHLQTEWSGDRFLEEAKEYWDKKGKSFEQLAQEKWGKEFESRYLSQLQSNIDTANMRLIIAADSIPSELRRMIEFLNNTYLIPTLLGASEQTRERKKTSRSQWSEARFFDVVEESLSLEIIEKINNLYNFAKELTDRKPDWGTGKETGSFTAKLDINGHLFSVLSVYTDGNISINIGWNHKRLSEVNKDISEKFRLEVNLITKKKFTQRSWEEGWPKITLESLSNQQLTSLMDLLKKFKKTLLEN